VKTNLTAFGQPILASLCMSLVCVFGAAFAPASHGQQSATPHESKQFYLRHMGSNKFVHPYKGGVPDQPREMVVHDDVPQEPLVFTIVQRIGNDDWGVIQQDATGGYLIMPADSSESPADNTGLLYVARGSRAAWFKIDQFSKRITHFGGSILCTEQAGPGNDDWLRLRDPANSTDSTCQIEAVDVFQYKPLAQSEFSTPVFAALPVSAKLFEPAITQTNTVVSFNVNGVVRNANGKEILVEIGVALRDQNGFRDLAIDPSYRLQGAGAETQRTIYATSDDYSLQVNNLTIPSGALGLPAQAVDPNTGRCASPYRLGVAEKITIDGKETLSPMASFDFCVY
jgi:hypothetical protein